MKRIRAVSPDVRCDVRLTENSASWTSRRDAARYHPISRMLIMRRGCARRSTLVWFLAAVLPAAAHAQGLGTLTGHVVGPGGPLVGASVSIASSQRTAVTRSEGSYQVSLPAGRYEVRTRLIGFIERIDSVTITPGAVTTKDFRMEPAATTLESVAIIGTRSQERTVISAPVPIDVLPAADLAQSGRTETAQMIQAVAPSLNFPRATIADGTDHIRPATLRGLSPDQTLVLINGKRRHPSALVNLNGFVGRGSQAVDLNAIPASMIDHIEILRDGAAAQYGSDAIAGVINIVLKSTAPNTLSFETGENVTTYNRGANARNAFAGQTDPVSAHDGNVMTSSLTQGWTFGSGGFFQLDAEVRDRDGTNRSLADPRMQYFAGDSRNNASPTMHFWQGDSYNHDTQLFFNTGQTFANGLEAYAFGGYGRRRGASAGMWRRPNDDRTVRAIYPDGFLPFIKSNIGDASATAGLKGTAAGWQWDLSSVLGQNAFRFLIDNSANVSLGNASPTSFDAGRLTAGQSATTLDLSREMHAMHVPVRIALGAEYRVDRYDITAGDSSSYRDGGVKVLDATGQPTTRLAPPGSQVFPGFRPSDAGSHSRNNVAGYVDLESDLSSRLLVGAAGRVEHYSDFGSTSTGKIDARFELVKGFNVRGAISTGFRAPSLGQEFFSSTATNFIAGVPFDIRTFPVNTPEARVLGASDLQPERSVNVSGGVAIEPTRNLGMTADYYHIAIDNRIVLSDNFTGDAVQALFANAGLAGVSGGRFFSNAIDTRSNGVDVVLNYGLTLGSLGALKLTSGYNHNVVAVTHVDSTPPALRAFQENLFGHTERTRIERGNPRDNFLASARYSHRAFDFTARTQRYGEVTASAGNATAATGPLDQTFGAKWITDASASLTLGRRYTLMLGADNVFDVYPDRQLNPGNPTTSNGGTSNFGIFPYNGISPFGFNGRFIYTRLSLGL